ncbi:MAG: enoyl-CoA hydratase, partial [Rhodanobacter sp.]
MDETPPDTAPPIRNRTFDEIAIGDSATIERSLTAEDVQLLATLYGDGDPQPLDPTCGAAPGLHGVIGHGMWGAALISAVLGTRLPGA